MQLSEKSRQIKQSTTFIIDSKAKKLIQEGRNIINLSVGEPDFNTAENVKNAGIIAINENFTRYTDVSGILDLRELICEKLKKDNELNYNPSNIVVSNGAKQAIYNSLLAIANPEDEVIIVRPYWLSYVEMVRLVGATPIIIDSTDYDSLKNALSPKTKAIIINYPNNPSSQTYDLHQLKIIADFAVENDLFVISDEIYEKIIFEGSEHISIASLNKEIFERTIVINGLSKSHAMTGWRMGYSASTQEIATAIKNIQSQTTSNINSITQKASIEAFKSNEVIIKMQVKEYQTRCDMVFEQLSQMKYIKVKKPQGAFYFYIDIEELFGKKYKGQIINDAIQIAEILLDDFNLAIIPCNDFGSNKHIRISFATSKYNLQLGIKNINEFLNTIE